MQGVSFPELDHRQAGQRVAQCVGALPSGGVKKLKKESFGTVLVTVLTVPRPLCFCFFLMVFNVTFFPLVQLIVQLDGVSQDAVTVTIRGETRRQEASLSADSPCTADDLGAVEGEWVRLIRLGPHLVGFCQHCVCEEVVG